MYVDKYTCSNKCWHTYIYIDRHTHAHIGIHIFKATHVYWPMDGYTQTWIYTHVCRHTYTHANRGTHIYTHTNMHINRQIEIDSDAYIYTYIFRDRHTLINTCRNTCRDTQTHGQAHTSTNTQTHTLDLSLHSHAPSSFSSTSLCPTRVPDACSTFNTNLLIQGRSQ